MLALIKLQSGDAVAALRLTVGALKARPRSPEEPARQAGPASLLRAISTVDTLMALQGVESPTERKKRAVAKGRNALDGLDALKLGFLDGSVDQPMLARLKVAADGLGETSGDPGLDEVLGEIDLRVTVELAKVGIR